MKILISGYGKMGKMIESIIFDKGIDYAGWSEDIQATDPVLAAECVCIDFTTPDAIKANYKFLAEHFKAVVIGTTGWNDIADEVKGYFQKCGTTLIYGSNFSIGVNVLFKTADYLSRMLAQFGGYTAAIEETHHIHKKDAPSGTAKSIAAIVDANMGVETPVEAKRIGEVPGIHTIDFRSEADHIVLTHEAFSRMGFASGAVLAATLTEKNPGVHEFKDILFKELSNNE